MSAPLSNLAIAIHATTPLGIGKWKHIENHLVQIEPDKTEKVYSEKLYYLKPSNSLHIGSKLSLSIGTSLHIGKFIRPSYQLGIALTR